LEPIHFGLREDSNDQYDWARFILDAIECGALEAGDVLVLDNAGVHQGEDSFEIIFQTCLHLGVQIQFLPAYSPELNPCELVFATVKANLRAHWRGGNLVAAIVEAFAWITAEQIWSFYFHCLDSTKSFSGRLDDT
jgi:transposase